MKKATKILSLFGVCHGALSLAACGGKVSEAN